MFLVGVFDHGARNDGHCYWFYLVNSYIVWIGQTLNIKNLLNWNLSKVLCYLIFDDLPTIVKQNLFLCCVTINFSKTAPCIDFQNDEEDSKTFLENIFLGIDLAISHE